MDQVQYDSMHTKVRFINTVILMICFLYLFDFFSPKLNTASMVFDAGISRESSGGLNGRSLFWLIISFVVFSLSFYRSFFKNITWLKTYFSFITLIIFTSILWSDFPSTSFTRVFLWILAGGSVSLLYVQETQYGNTKKVFITLSGMLLAANIVAAIISPYGAFSYEGAMSGISVGKNVFGGIAAIFSIALTAILIEFESQDRRYKLYIQVMLALWLVFLVLSSSKSSIAFAIILIPSMCILKFKIRFILYFMFFFIFIFMCLLPIIYHLLHLDLFNEYSAILPPDLFTGRGIIWTYIFSEFNDFFWLGIGYGAYWVGTVRDIFDFEYSFFTVLNSSHNGYIHIFTNIGVLGLTLFIFITLIKLIKFSSRLELWELSILVFISLHTFFETDFLVYKNFWILFCAILTRLEYKQIKCFD